ncbi:MAG: hypothetical protein GQ570_12115 [Helicobacteraceae bacterium]|nr:hypothetical protein [Helicobacteraceae bacterium]
MTQKDVCDHAIISKKLQFDTSIKDKDFRFYSLISMLVGDGFMWHSNATLEKLSGKKQVAISRALKALVKANYIVIEHNVRESYLYPKDLKRVIWLYDAYYGAKAREAKENEPPTLNEPETYTIAGTDFNKSYLYEFLQHSAQSFAIIKKEAYKARLRTALLNPNDKKHNETVEGFKSFLFVIHNITLEVK